MAMAINTTTQRPRYLRGNNFFLVIARLVPSGSYTAGGDVLSLQTLSKTSKKKPIAAWVHCDAAGFLMTYDLLNERVRIWTNTAGGVNGELTEHTAASLAAAITSGNTTINVFAIFA